MQVDKQIKKYEDGQKSPNVLTQAQQNKLLAIRPTPVKDNRITYMDDDINSDEQDDYADDVEIVRENQIVKDMKKLKIYSQHIQIQRQ
ncbi:MAG: hypothetical protein EZS28_014016 [Streblomastix strix]|uniref:Uncharacterized protein n=1 Tax=Streblomastix strix TaxID=222440 RepID=A0A5J4W6Q9_9EUKA|nr:MAG: hypothetical protein EZS28_014016 [Streblomastix strix]